MYRPMSSWVGKTRKKALREKFMKQAAERELKSEAQRAEQIERCETSSEDLRRQNSKIRSNP
jgi:hypothetical protein